MSCYYGTEGYYKKLIELQDKLRKSEEERLQLEIKFNEMVQVTKDEKQNHFRHLRAQYNRFLEEDKNRQDRNARIVRTLDKIDSRAQSLAAKTERFKILRKQYQILLRRAYNCKTAVQKEEKVDLSDAKSVREALICDQFGSKEKRDILQSYLRNSTNKIGNSNVPFSIGLKPSNLDYLYSSNFGDGIQMDNNSTRVADEILTSIEIAGIYSKDTANVLAQRHEMESDMPSGRIKSMYANVMKDDAKQYFGRDATVEPANAPVFTWNKDLLTTTHTTNIAGNENKIRNESANVLEEQKHERNEPIQQNEIYEKRDMSKENVQKSSVTFNVDQNVVGKINAFPQEESNEKLEPVKSTLPESSLQKYRSERSEAANSVQNSTLPVANFTNEENKMSSSKETLLNQYNLEEKDIDEQNLPSMKADNIAQSTLKKTQIHTSKATEANLMDNVDFTDIKSTVMLGDKGYLSNMQQAPEQKQLGEHAQLYQTDREPWQNDPEGKFLEHQQGSLKENTRKENNGQNVECSEQSSSQNKQNLGNVEDGQKYEQSDYRDQQQCFDTVAHQNEEGRYNQEINVEHQTSKHKQHFVNQGEYSQDQAGQYTCSEQQQYDQNQNQEQPYIDNTQYVDQLSVQDQYDGAENTLEQHQEEQQQAVDGSQQQYFKEQYQDNQKEVGESQQQYSEDHYEQQAVAASEQQYTEEQYQQQPASINQQQYSQQEYQQQPADINQQQYSEEQCQQQPSNVNQQQYSEQEYQQQPVDINQQQYSEEQYQQQPADINQQQYSEEQYQQQPTDVNQQQYFEQEYQQQPADINQQQYSEEQYQQQPADVNQQQYSEQEYQQQPADINQQQYSEEQYQQQSTDINQQQYSEGQYQQQYAEGEYSTEQQYIDRQYREEQQYVEGQYSADQQEYVEETYEQKGTANKQQYIEGQYVQQGEQQQYVEGQFNQGDQQQYNQIDQQQYNQGDQQQYNQVGYDTHGQQQCVEGEQHSYDTQQDNKPLNSEYMDSGLDQGISENIPEHAIEKKPDPNFADMLETDTESSRQDTKVSNESDFDFSNK